MKFFKSLFLSIAALLFASAASATCVQNCPEPVPAPITMGLTTTGWYNSGAIGVGQTNGTGKVVTGEAISKTEEMFKLGAVSFLTGNANPLCAVNCSDSQSKLSFEGFSMAGVATLGTASNNAGGAATQAVSGLNGMFKGSLGQGWTYTTPPAPKP